LVALAGALIAAAQFSPTAGANSLRHARQERVLLTRWRKVSFWAHPSYPVPVHAKPTISSRVVGKLHYRTEQRLREVYLVLTRIVRPDGRVWLRIALPMRPNGTTGWVVHRALGALHRVDSWLLINRTRLRARFYDRGRLLWSAPVGIGSRSTPTPQGLFWVRERLVLNPVIYGPLAFGTSAYSTLSDWPGGGVVGVHGTSAPYLIPGRPSHGCVRLRNTDILWLGRHMPVGTPISILH
jgi:hypothetical protein